MPTKENGKSEKPVKRVLLISAPATQRSIPNKINAMPFAILLFIAFSPELYNLFKSRLDRLSYIDLFND